jgi:hypothetical protein
MRKQEHEARIAAGSVFHTCYRHPSPQTVACHPQQDIHISIHACMQGAVEPRLGGGLTARVEGVASSNDVVDHALGLRARERNGRQGMAGAEWELCHHAACEQQGAHAAQQAGEGVSSFGYSHAWQQGSKRRHEQGRLAI